MTTLSKTCPICKHEWIVRCNWKSLGGIFLKADFAIAMFDHLQSHTSDEEVLVRPYEYNKGVNVETQIKSLC